MRTSYLSHNNKHVSHMYLRCRLTERYPDDYVGREGTDSTACCYHTIMIDSSLIEFRIAKPRSSYRSWPIVVDDLCKPAYPSQIEYLINAYPFAPTIRIYYSAQKPKPTAFPRIHRRAYAYGVEQRDSYIPLPVSYPQPHTPFLTEYTNALPPHPISADTLYFRPATVTCIPTAYSTISSALSLLSSRCCFLLLLYAASWSLRNFTKSLPFSSGASE